MKKTKLLVGVLAVAMLGSICLAGCNEGSYNETFEGVVSADVYTNEKTAAAAFIQNELEGSTTTAEIIDYEKSADLSEEEIAALNLGNYSAADVTAAEVGIVTYSTGAASVYAASATAENKKAELYLLQFGDVYRYYVPQPGEGEMISKSYLESVYNSESYTNCTVVSKAAMTVNVSAYLPGYGSQKATVTSEATVTIKITETAAEITTVAKASISGTGIPKTTNTEKETFYVLENEWGTGLVAYYKSSNDRWYSTSFAEYEKLSDLFAYEQTELDHTFFEKTATGFKLSADKFNEYLNEVLAENEEMQEYFDSMTNFSCEATYFVADGRLAKETMKVTLNLSVSEGGYTTTGTAKLSASASFSAFGTTTVKLPAGIEVDA